MRDLVDELLQAKVQATLFGGDHAPRLGRLVLLDRIGSGAMGTVFAAYDPSLDRKVAIKLVPARAADHERILGEARALAKLAHPNVVAVHDVGELEDQIYIVMELVAGVPLRTWIAGDRDWHDVVRVMAEAAAGLAAAHRAGLVHRDLKPDNILVGEDRTRIVDFGLARDPRTGDDARGAGTPAYMAPEVLEERDATPASDQFSFGVTLYEALYGVRPHTGRTRDELRASAKQAASALARPGRAVRSQPPGWLHAIVARALAADPLNRFGSMAELAAALERDRRRRHRIAGLVAAGALAGAALAVVAYRHREPPELCGGGPARREAMWPALRSDHVKRSLGAAAWTGKALAGLDATAARWEDSYRAVCEATRVRGDQSDTLLDLRMRCLDRAADRFTALGVALAGPLDGASRAQATTAIAALPDPAACETLVDPGELARPADPVARARVVAAERIIDRAWAQYEPLGRYAAAGETLRELGDTRALGAPAVHAEALLVGAAVEGRIGQPAAAAQQLEAAVVAAAAAKAPELELAVWARLLRHELFAGTPAKAIEWSTFALAAAARAGHEGAEIEGIVGEAMRDAGNVPGARIHLARALTSKDPLRGEQRALLEMNAGAVELAAGLPAAAEPALQRALVLARGALGDDHPTLAIYLDKLAAADRARGRVRAALARHDQSLALRIAAFGASDRSVATSLLGRARTLLEANRLDEAARDAARALEIRTAAYGAASPRLGEVIAIQGDLALARGDLANARDLYGRAATLDARLDLVARRAAAGAIVTLDDLPTSVEPLTIDRAAALARRVPLLPPEQARSLAFALRTHIAGAGPFDPALALPIAEALAATGDRAGAAEIAARTLGQLGEEPSRSRDRAAALAAR